MYHIMVGILGVRRHRKHGKWLYLMSSCRSTELHEVLASVGDGPKTLEMHWEVDREECGRCCTVPSGDTREKGFCHFGTQETQEWEKVTLVSVGWPESLFGVISIPSVVRS